MVTGRIAITPLIVLLGPFSRNAAHVVGQHAVACGKRACTGEASADYASRCALFAGGWVIASKLVDHTSVLKEPNSISAPRSETRGLECLSDAG